MPGRRPHSHQQRASKPSHSAQPRQKYLLDQTKERSRGRPGAWLGPTPMIANRSVGKAAMRLHVAFSAKTAVDLGGRALGSRAKPDCRPEIHVVHAPGDAAPWRRYSVEQDHGTSRVAHRTATEHRGREPRHGRRHACGPNPERRSERYFRHHGTSSFEKYDPLGGCRWARRQYRGGCGGGAPEHDEHASANRYRPRSQNWSSPALALRVTRRRLCAQGRYADQASAHRRRAIS
jgi:hypothetical protein